MQRRYVMVVLTALGFFCAGYLTGVVQRILNMSLHDEARFQDPRYDAVTVLSETRWRPRPVLDENELMGYVGPSIGEAESCTKWMFNNRKAIWGKTLDDITIPGTHDSGAYDMNSHIMPGSLPESMIKMLEWLKRLRLTPSPFLIKWAETQRKTVTQQLNDGIRFLDLRAGWNGTHWVAVHTIQGTELFEIFSEIRDFLDSTTHEVLVVEMYHIYNGGKEEKEALAHMVTDLLGPYLAPCCFKEIWKKPLNWYWKSNKRLIMVTTLPCLPPDSIASYVDQSFAQNLLEAGEGHEDAPEGIVCPWYYKRTVINTWADSDNLQTMWQYNDGVLDKFEREPGSLLKMSWTLTPAVKTVIHGIFRKPKSLIEMAMIANKAFPDFLAEKEAQGRRDYPQIMISDVFLTSHIVPLTNRINGLPECAGSNNDLKAIPEK